MVNTSFLEVSPQRLSREVVDIAGVVEPVVEVEVWNSLRASEVRPGEYRVDVVINQRLRGTGTESVTCAWGT